VKKKPSYLRQNPIRRSTRYQSIKAFIAGICAFVLGILLVKAGAAYLAQSSNFRLNNIRISGCRITSPDKILSYADIEKGMNLLLVNLGQTSTRIEQYPYINKAVVQRKLPGTLEIYLEERKPRAIIQLDGYYLLDTNGEIFKKAEAGELRYPVLTGLTTETFYKDRQGCLQIIRNALQLLGHIEKDKRFRGLQIEIAIDQISGFTIRTTPEPMEVNVGWEEFAEKIDSLWKIVDDLKSKGLSPGTIKLKSPQKAYVMVRE
jgi:cell division septal protein FtsQ